MAFRHHQAHVPPETWLVAAEYAGRGARHGDVFSSTVQDIADEVHLELLALQPKEIILVGHSFGGLVAYEVARRLTASDSRWVRHLAVVGRQAPGHRPDGPPLHELSRAELLEFLKSQAGTPATLLECAELIDAFLPSLRSDLKCCDEYRDLGGSALTCSLTCHVGVSEHIELEDVRPWGSLTRGRFRVRRHPGGHFAIHEDPGQLMAAVMADAAGDDRQVDGLASPSATEGGTAHGG